MKVGDIVMCVDVSGATSKIVMFNWYKVEEVYSWAGTLRVSDVTTGEIIHGIGMYRFVSCYIETKEEKVNKLLQKLDDKRDLV